MIRRVNTWISVLDVPPQRGAAASVEEDDEEEKAPAPKVPRDARDHRPYCQTHTHVIQPYMSYKLIVWSRGGQMPNRTPDMQRHFIGSLFVSATF